MIKVENPIEFNDAFGEINVEQMKVLVKLMKHVRGRCRSNVALLNWLTMMFPHLKFAMVTREFNGSTYTTMEIK